MTTADAIRLGLSWLGTYALHSTLLLGAAWALCRWFPPRAVRERERLWRWTLIGGVLTASLQVGLGTRPLLGRLEWNAPRSAALESPALEPAAGLESAPRARTPLVAPAPLAREHRERSGRAKKKSPATVTPRTASPTLASSRDASTPAAEPSTTRRWAASSVREPPFPEPSSSPVARVRPAAAPATAPRAALRAWPQLLLAAWAGAGLVGFLGLALTWNLLRRLLAGRRPVTEGPLFERFEALRRRAGIRGRVRLSTSAHIPAPFSTGILRREVCVPLAVASQLGARQQEAILAHELAHVQRRDPAWQGLFAVLERALFFQPLNRLARAELAELAELASDDLAVRWTGARLALARSLTEVAAWILDERRQPLGLPGLVGPRSRLARRVTRLLEDGEHAEAPGRRSWSSALAAVTLAGVALAVPGIAATPDPAATRQEPRAVPASLPSSATRPARPPRQQPPRAPSARPETAAGLASAPSPGLEAERRLLQDELELLRSEVLGLTAELERLELRDRFAEPIERLHARLEELEGQHERIGALLARLSPAGAGASPTTPRPQSTSENSSR